MYFALFACCCCTSATQTYGSQKFEVGESLSDCASMVVEWNDSARKIYPVSSMAGTLGTTPEAHGFLLSRTLFPPHTCAHLAPSSKRWRNRQLTVFRSAFIAMTTVRMESFVTSSSTHASAFQRAERPAALTRQAAMLAWVNCGMIRCLECWYRRLRNRTIDKPLQ